MKFQKMEGLGNTFFIALGPAEITPEFVRKQCSNVDCERWQSACDYVC